MHVSLTKQSCILASVIASVLAQEDAVLQCMNTLRPPFTVQSIERCTTDIVQVFIYTFKFNLLINLISINNNILYIQIYFNFICSSTFIISFICIPFCETISTTIISI